MDVRKIGVPVLIGFSAMALTACATLLMLPDEQTEEYYTTQSQAVLSQVDSKLKVSPGGKASPPKEGEKKSIRVLPIVYDYTVHNTLKKGEEAYYVSVFYNGSGSWIRPFTQIAQMSVAKQLEARGYDYSLLSNNALTQLGAKNADSYLSPGSDRRRGDPVRSVAFNAENNGTNLALVNQNDFRKFIGDDEQGVLFMKFDADWEPSTANTLNKDIVLNSTVTLGYKMVFCGVDACSTIEIPFKDGLKTSLPMPNRNTINDQGLDKNYDLIKKLHGAQIDKIVEASFQKLDAMGAFVK